MSSIYLDNASTSYVYPECIEIVSNSLKEHWGNPSNLYKIGRESKTIIDNAKEEIASILKVEPGEIFFTSGASEGNAWALSQREWTYCSLYEHHNYVENNNCGAMSDEDFLLLRSPRPNIAYAHMLVSNETGEIFNVSPLFSHAKELGMFTICDMTQAYGNMHIAMTDVNCDMAIFSGHKFHAPKGVGFVYISKDVQKNFKPMICGTQQNGFRGGTENIPYIEAITYAAYRANKEIEIKTDLSKRLSDKVIELLKTNDIDFTINRGEENIDTTLNFALANVESDILQIMLSDTYSIYIGVGSGCNNGNLDDNITLSEMGVSKKYIRGPIRFSYSLKNTEEEVIEATTKLIDCYNQIR